MTVTPAARHLYQLREQIYQNVRLHSETPEKIAGFKLEQEEKLRYLMVLRHHHSLDLLQMTPFAWRATNELKQYLSQQEEFICETDFMLRFYKKDND